MDVYDVTMGYDVTMETGGNHGNGVRQTVESLQNRLKRRHRTMEIITMDHNGSQWSVRQCIYDVTEVTMVTRYVKQ